MNNPKISIVTVSFNAINAIENTILSVINQTYPNIEYIIIDGGSTDGTVDIIKKYDNKISYWISEPDNGIYDAMNKAIEKATGEWINFMNAGDIFYSDTIVQELANTNIFNNKNTIIYGNRIVNTSGVMKEQVSRIKTIKHSMDIFHQSIFTYTSLHKEHLFNTSYQIAGDYDFLYKMINNNINFIKVNMNICIFLYGGISCENINQLKEVLRVIRTNNFNKIDKVYFSILCIICKKYPTSILLKQYFPSVHKIIKNIYLKLE
jgi:glycosyltransferase involved in cell wall biosynthesis